VDISSIAGDIIAQQTGMLQARIAMATTVKMMQVQKEMGEQIVALLDPNKGTQLNVSA
jgi:hypothetical protein